MASVLYHLGDLVAIVSVGEEAEALVREGLTIQQDLGDRRGMAGSLRVLGVIATRIGPLEEIERRTRESVAAFRAVGDRAHAAEALINWGQGLARLGDLARARSRLEESVAIYRDLGFGGISSSASLAILGEVDMLLGRYEEARASAQEALAMAQERAYSIGIVGSLWVLGRVAIAEGEYARAQQLLQQAFSMTGEATASLWGIIFLGYAARGLGQPGQAWRHLCKVLHAGFRGMLLDVLPAIALLLADRGEAERAVELYALASRYSYVSNAQWFEDIAGKEIAAVAATLKPDVVAAAQARGRARDLDATVKELLAELGDD
jgi:tetratricopeptide (TPR) repeat protein